MVNAHVTHTFTVVVWSLVPAGSQRSYSQKRAVKPRHAAFGTLLDLFPMSLKQLRLENDSKELGGSSAKRARVCGSGHRVVQQLSF